jgi:hypothetical protein
MSVTYPEHVYIDPSFPHDEGDLAKAIEAQGILMIAILRNTLADKLSGDDNAVVDKALDALHGLLVVQAHPTRDCDRVDVYSDGSEVIWMAPTDTESAPQLRVSEVITDKHYLWEVVQNLTKMPGYRVVVNHPPELPENPRTPGGLFDRLQRGGRA